MEKLINIIKGFFDKKVIIIILLIVIGWFVVSLQRQRIREMKNKYETEVKLRNAISSKIDSVENKNGELVLSKKTLQTDIKRLTELKNNLTENQKKLLFEIQKKNKKNKVLAAANMEMSIIIDSLNKVISNGKIDSINKEINFEDSTKYLEYNFNVTNVIPYNNDKPVKHVINYLEFPNTQTITFDYDKDKRKDGYPISFNIKNTNKYMKVYDIDSYIIEEIDVDQIETNFFDEIWSWYNRQTTIVKLGTGFIIGGGTVYILK
jgi:hypothetical protein